jgi:hypothetical protein
VDRVRKRDLHCVQAWIRAEPDPRRKLAIYARATREIHARLAPL